jgi:hypothetical protein
VSIKILTTLCTLYSVTHTAQQLTVNDDDATRILDDHVKNTLLTGFVTQCNEDRLLLSEHIKKLPNKLSLVVYNCYQGSTRDPNTTRPFTAQG